MNYLLLTLGHSSSAIFVEANDDKEVTNVIGYEQERISGIKGDSQFPTDAINEIRKHVAFEKLKGCTIYVSHWFDFGSPIPNKYITSENLNLLNSFEPSSITYVNDSFTHHDAHAYSAYSFFNWYRNKENLTADAFVIVADGFGNNQEVLSIYKTDNWNNKLVLLDRFYGYDISLGLMYQYATSFVGMKENQDEYKFLGYEALAEQYLSYEQIHKILYSVDKTVDNLFIDSFEHNTHIQFSKKTDDVIDFETLSFVKDFWNRKFQYILDNIGIESNSSCAARVAIAIFVQRTIERVIAAIVEEYNARNVIVVGGCFFNVKLNNSILENIPGFFCAMPLAGDQGAAIGMLEYFKCVQFPFDTLAIGRRNFYNLEKYVNNQRYKDRIVICKNLSESADEIARKISDGEMVNIVTKYMEFGPRALCSTSTLFLPTKKNAEKNNRMNGRNEVMPFAPLCTEENAKELFCESINRVLGSNRFMICTHTYTKPYSNQYAGVMHKKALFDNIYTGRPQVVDCVSSFIGRVLINVQEYTDAKCIVNTSFNVHGHPIVFNLAQIFDNFNYQCEQCERNNEELPFLFFIDF